MTTKTETKMSVKSMTRIAMMSVLAFVLMQIELPLPIFPGFLKIDASDVPALITGFALGPVAGVMVELIKNVIHLLQTSTAGIGELANFIIGSAIIVPSALIYKRSKSRKSAVIGLLVGTVAMAIAGGLANYFILLPFYAKIMPLDVIIQMGTVANSNILDIKSLIVYGVVPFNIFKGLVLSLITMLLYKRISPLLNK